MAAIDFTIPGEGKRFTRCRVVNAYGPTMLKVSENPQLRDSFYSELSSVVNKTPSRYQLFICGDFNSKLGTRSTDDEDAGLSSCIGAHGKGKRNNNGEALIEFLLHNGLFASNTAFQHASRHKTTWTGWVKDRHAPPHSAATRPVYNQIDYILCKTTSKPLLTDARSYGGATTSSDHKLVIARLQFANMPLVWKTSPQRNTVAYNIEQLTSDTLLQEAYCEELHTRVSATKPANNPNKALTDLLNSVKISAATTIGTVPTSKRKRICYDPLVISLSKQQKQLRLQIEASQDTHHRTSLRHRRGAILKQINHRLRNLACHRADQLANEIASTDDSRRMFRAVQAIKSTKHSPPLTVHTPDGKCIGTDHGKAEAIRKWFELQFSDPNDEPLTPFSGSPRPLNQPVTATEVDKALQSLHNGRASGPDSINSELLKYAASVVSSPIANIINSMFEQHISLDSLGKGTLIALPKPNKPPGPPSNLRPIVLLNCIRKVISLISLHRIQRKVDFFTGVTQGGFKRGRSCADIVWAQRMLISVVQYRHWQFHKMGIDMSRAFDTIKRRKILEVLELAGCNEDELRLIQTYTGQHLSNCSGKVLTFCMVPNLHWITSG